MRGPQEREPDRIAALASLYEARYHSFLRVAEAIVRSEGLAHDVVQEAFARAIRARSGFRGEGNLEAWVWRVVVNTARNARRDKPPAHAPLGAASEPAAGDVGEENERVRDLVSALPERQRLVLFLRYYADLDYHGIAAALEISPGTVGATLNQAHAALRRLLEEVPT
jgi:RNA polymerase sigma-70 factor (ECF subfamily)